MMSEKIGQNMVVDGVPVRTKGGWVQVNIKPSLQWEIGAGAAIDDPEDEDLLPTSRLRNEAFEGHLLLRFPPAVLGLELREIRTRYADPLGTRSATHANLGVGFEF